MSEDSQRRRISLELLQNKIDLARKYCSFFVRIRTFQSFEGCGMFQLWKLQS